MVLILLLPLGRHWRLLSFGERVEGTVKEFNRHKSIDFFGEGQLIEASEVHFPVGDSMHVSLGPVDLALDSGKNIPVYYNLKDPSENILFNFSCLYLSSYSILPLILIFVWWAFYLSYNNYHKERKGESLPPSSSPYIPFRRGLFSSRTRGNPKQESRRK